MCRLSQHPDLACKSSIRYLSILLLLFLAAPESSAASPAEAEAATISLELSKPIERTVAGEEVHSYAITLSSGQYAQIAVDQRGVDVAVTVLGSDGKSLFQVDSPHSTHGPERIAILADSPATYRIDVELQTKPVGRYEIKLEELRMGTQQDRKRVAAQKLSFEAKALRNQRTEESFQQGIEKYHAAIVIWRELGDKAMEAATLHEMGLLYGDISQYQRALDCYSQARTLYKALGNPGGAASILSNIAWIYGNLGEAQKSLEMYDQVLEEYKELGEIDAVLLS